VGGEFGDERPATFPGGFVEKILEWAFQSEFVDNLVIHEVPEVFDVGPDDRVGGVSSSIGCMNRIVSRVAQVPMGGKMERSS
jgi:hypothetical protein